MKRRQHSTPDSSRCFVRDLSDIYRGKAAIACLQEQWIKQICVRVRNPGSFQNECESLLGCTRSRYCANMNDNVQEYLFVEPPSGSTIIRNVKLFDYFYHSQPGSKPWKKLRKLKNVVEYAYMILTVAWVFTFVLINVPPDEVYIIEVAFAITFLPVQVAMLLLANVDTALLHVKSAIALADMLCLIIVVILLALFGQGFVLFGSLSLTCIIVMAYTTEAAIIDRRLNSRSRLAYLEFMARVAFLVQLVTITVFRAIVFFKQITVADDIVLADLSANGGELFTLRDLWEFFVDVLVFRTVYMDLNRLRQPVESIDVGRRYARLLP